MLDTTWSQLQVSHYRTDFFNCC